MIDLTQHAPPKYLNKKQPVRKLETITGITLHQTSCFYTPGAVKSWQRLNAHIGIARDGNVYLVNPYEMFVWHAHGLSKSTIGIEVEGKLPGIIGNVKTIWEYKPGDPVVMTAKQREALVDVLTELHARFPRLDIWAHRQSHKFRTWDPGEEVWKLAMGWAAGKAGISVPMEKSLGSGQAIPGVWR